MSIGDNLATMPEIIRRWAEYAPDLPAMIEDGRQPLTYRALADLSERVRRSLNSCGYGRNDRIAIVHPGGAEMAAVVIGTWCGATAAPLNPDYTLAEFAVHFRDLGIKAVLVAADLDTPARKAADVMHLPVIEVFRSNEDVTGMVALRADVVGKARRPEPAQADDIALVLATSGTTSLSKIVPIRHRQLTARIRLTAELFELTPDDRCLNLMPYFHGHGLYTSLGTTLYSGGSLISMARFDVDTFFQLLESLRPTWYTGSYTFHHTISAHAARYKALIDRNPLRFIRTSSGRLDTQIAEKLEAIFSAPVIETYSTTETGRICGNPQPPGIRKRGTVGKPAGGEVAIMGPAGEFLPDGERGEVVVRGAHIFDGYENDPAANAAAFVDGWFRTGDEGVFDDDGYLTLTGRIKEVINRGGEKIMPDEIDAALLRHPDVDVAVTFPVPHVTLGQEVAAAVVPHPGAALTDEVLTRFLRGKLAPFKVPRRFVFVDHIPKSHVNKIQRRSLAAAFGLAGQGPKRQVTDRPTDRPPTPLEAMLQAIWADALGLDHVGLHDDFFLLGGDSLQAVELFMRIEQELERRLPRSILFEASTVAKMARCIDDITPPRCLVPIQPNGRRPPFFCIHDGNGQVFNFRELARHMGDEQPFYGIQCLGLDGEDVPYMRVEDMAAHYIREIRKVQPSGPYFLGGYSFGGRVAYVMAQQLRTAGDEVALLALLDTYCHLGQRRVGLRQWFARHCTRLRALSPAQVPAYLWMRSANVVVMTHMAVRLRIFSTAVRYYESRGRRLPRFLRRPVAANDIIRRDYRPQPYEGNATLFKAELYAWNHTDSHDGWSELIKGKLEIRPIPGRHFEILKPPHVRALAAELTNCLERAQPRAQKTAGPIAQAS